MVGKRGGEFFFLIIALGEEAEVEHEEQVVGLLYAGCPDSPPPNE